MREYIETIGLKLALVITYIAALISAALIVAYTWRYLLLALGYFIPFLSLCMAIDHPENFFPKLRLQERILLRTAFVVFFMVIIVAETIVFWNIAKIVLAVWLTMEFCVQAVLKILKK